MGLSLRMAGTPLYMGSAYVKYVIEAQGYTVQHNILLQGNKSTILLATNGRFSTSKKTKHIKTVFYLYKTRSKQVALKFIMNHPVVCGQMCSQNPSKGKLFGSSEDS